MSIAATLRAVEQALSAGHPAGGTRVLAVADWFVLGLPVDGNADAASSVMAREHKRAWVEITNIAARADTQEIGATTGYDLRIEVRCTYYAGHGDNRTEVRDCHLTAAEDFHKVRQALCWPGNLTADASGNATGLAGGALVGLDATWQRTVFNQTARSLRTLSAFRATVFV